MLLFGLAYRIVFFYRRVGKLVIVYSVYRVYMILAACQSQQTRGLQALPIGHAPLPYDAKRLDQDLKRTMPNLHLPIPTPLHVSFHNSIAHQ